ncbi:MAG: hypothetical protein WDA03_05890 [Trueperaceae bacterium]|jgi:F-type H+-transporting ATPase subunit epsilon
MRFLLTVPSGKLVDQSVARLSAESVHGSFTILGRHADTALLITPGLLAFQPVDGEETFVAVDHGVLVKAGDQVRVACQRAVVSGDLGSAEAAVRSRFLATGESDKRARNALLRLEAEILRHVGELRS